MEAPMHAQPIAQSLQSRASYKLLSLTGLVTVGDMLLYNHALGWTLGLFGLLMLLAVHAHNCHERRTRMGDAAFFATAGLALAMVESPGILSALLYGISLTAYALLPQLGSTENTWITLKSSLFHLLTGWWRFFRQTRLWLYLYRHMKRRNGRQRHFVLHWLMPLTLTALFMLLFFQANPLIALTIRQVNWQSLGEYISFQRMAFWLAIAAVGWAVIRPKLTRMPVFRLNYLLHEEEIGFLKTIFNPRSIITSLLLFNGLFLLQNIMDILFIWTGSELPEGITHAQYAQQGAYPLIITALMTGGFTLATLRPGSAIAAIPAIRALVYAWVAQNIFLVTSAALRLLSYIEAYSLTYLRVAALLWMVLVGVGLALIVLGNMLRKNNIWLINSNLATLYGLLYICCFVNIGGIMADYNVKHCREIDGKGASLDVSYLYHKVGVDALPALRWFEHNGTNAFVLNRVTETDYQLEWELRSRMENWKSWTYRNLRLLPTIDNDNAE
ncbi:DUF4173 domain-containing protein [bacterium]|nr:DUF4173 domain-containing protein [bacterium]